VQRRTTDPGILELVGELTDLLGLAEKIQRYLPTQRLKIQRKHRRIERLLDDFRAALDDSRAAMRVVTSTLQEHLAHADSEPTQPAGAQDQNLPRIAFSIPREELAVYRRGIEQLQVAIRKMTNIGFDLEATSEGVPEETQRYYRISEAGKSILRAVRDVLDDNPERLPGLVRQVEQHLARSSRMLEEREQWIHG